MQKSQPLIVTAIIVMAIVLAAGSFLLLSYLQGRPDAPEGTLVRNIEGVDVTINMDPEKEVRLLSLEQVPVSTEGEQPTDQQPDQTQQTQPDDTPVPITEPATAVPTPIPTAAPNPVIFTDYTVIENDSLYRIAQRPDTAIVLMAQYDISQEDLVPGSVIKLPVGNPAYCPEENRQPYAVRENDTAYAIGKRFNVTADKIQEINNLDENHTVYAAQIICVPFP